MSQFSNDPNIVRVVVYYNEGFNPKNIRLKFLNNSFFVQFLYPSLNNYYFQSIYSSSKPLEFYENTKIQYKIPAEKNSVFNQINSSFNNNSDQDDLMLSNEDVLLKSKYYVENIKFKGAIPVIYGAGSYTLSKPMYLANPSRAVFDLHNTTINPSIHNKEFPIVGAETIKIAQFDKNTARIVITSPSPEKFIPIIYPDTQRLVFLDSKTVSPQNLFTTNTNLTLIQNEKTNDLNYGLKFIFNKPLLVGISNLSNSLDLYLYNLSSNKDIKSELVGTPFENIIVKDISHNGGVKLSLKTELFSDFNIHLGADGKTLRLKAKLDKPFDSKISVPEPVVAKVPAFTPHNDGKHYVIIDAGHGGSDVGATRNNIYEKDITLDVAKRVEKLLKAKGNYVIAMTRENDNTVSLQERVDMSEVFNPDIFISIHVNSSNSDSPYGLETHYYKENSLQLAKCVHASMLNNIDSKDRGLFKSKFYVINHTTAPAILVETGFISNPQERSQLVTESRKNATAKAIAEGIDEYFK